MHLDDVPEVVKNLSHDNQIELLSGREPLNVAGHPTNM